jgi:hypothetical protein
VGASVGLGKGVCVAGSVGSGVEVTTMTRAVWVGGGVGELTKDDMAWQAGSSSKAVVTRTRVRTREVFMDERSWMEGGYSLSVPNQCFLSTAGSIKLMACPVKISASRTVLRGVSGTRFPNLRGCPGNAEKLGEFSDAAVWFLCCKR